MEWERRSGWGFFIEKNGHVGWGRRTNVELLLVCEKKNVEKKIVGLPVQFCQCPWRRGGEKESAAGENPCGKTSDEDGGEEAGNVETSEPRSCGRIHPNVFAGYRLQRECAPPPGRKEEIEQNFE